MGAEMGARGTGTGASREGGTPGEGQSVGPREMIWGAVREAPEVGDCLTVGETSHENRVTKAMQVTEPLGLAT